jgi:hypothetical protein
MSFESLKKQSKLGSLTEKLVKEVEKLNTTGSNVDIRFLPAPEGEDLPWVKMYSHGFQGPGGWYIENSLTTLGQKDPVSELNRGLWNSGSDKDKETVRKQKRKLSYFSNIYVVKDPANPENEGKVFLFKYGKKIFDKILNAMQPEFDDEEPINPFDFWQGANFRLKLVKKDGYWNYDKSDFAPSSPLMDDDDALEAIWKKEYSLSALIAPDQFKSYEDLEKRMNYVLGIGKVAPKASSMDEEEEYESYVPKQSKEESVMEELEESYRKSKSVPQATSSDSDDDEDDALSYFQRLAED